MTSLKTIRLYGKLGTKFGRLHRLAVNSAAEAVRALCALRPGFERELMTSRDRGIGYAVFLGKKNLKEEQLTEEAEEREIRIAPVLQGAGFGSIFKIILGVVLVVVSYFIPASWGVWGEVLAGTRCRYVTGDDGHYRNADTQRTFSQRRPEKRRFLHF